MPGPVSDSYDPEFGTGARAEEVRLAICKVRRLITQYIGSAELVNIVGLAEGYGDGEMDHDHRKPLLFSERELRIIRFSLNRAIDSI